MEQCGGSTTDRVLLNKEQQGGGGSILCCRDEESVGKKIRKSTNHVLLFCLDSHLGVQPCDTFKSSTIQADDTDQFNTII